MRFTAGHWTLAVFLSLALHGALAWWIVGQHEDEPPMIEGSPGVSIAVAGDPFDAVAAGDSGETDTPPADIAPSEVVDAEVAEPVDVAETPETPVEAMPTETAEPVPSEAMTPTDQAPAETRQPETVEPAEATPPPPAETPTALAAVPETAKPEITPPTTSATVAAVEPETAKPEPTEVAPAETVQTAEAETEQAVPAETMVATTAEVVEAEDPQPDNVPRPTARPTPPRRVAQADPTPRRETPKRITTRAKPRAGDNGKQAATAQRGSRNQGNAARTAGGGVSRVEATAARSNYSGEILRRIRRAQRYPSQARRERAEGTATVAFTVSSGGGVSGVRLVRSSGHTILDNAVVDLIRRAAPFPPIPAAAGRSSMSFTVPVAYQIR
ncbi:TonB family protein [Consotaella aegiceratis]|uniref:TonB family protein n=1 Tax=Consotaella aegiceratis TaxID=3097961 RepID=UPI002F3FB93E